MALLMVSIFLFGTLPYVAINLQTVETYDFMLKLTILS